MVFCAVPVVSVVSVASVGECGQRVPSACPVLRDEAEMVLERAEHIPWYTWDLQQLGDLFVEVRAHRVRSTLRWHFLTHVTPRMRVSGAG